MSSYSELSQNDYKKTLLSRLLDGVKGCQSRYGSRSELATEDEDSVSRLCAAYEDVFLHGFKKSVQQSSNSKAAFWVPAALRPAESVTFWPLVKYQLSKHEAERFLLLHHVRSDAGRCRAWIRASLNEHTLERDILLILSLDCLQDFYEPWAFLRDHELNAILPQTAAGLGSVLFALTVDNPVLDTFTYVMAKEVPETISNPDVQDAVEVADQAILALSHGTTSNISTIPTPSVGQAIAPDNLSKTKVCKKKKKKPPVNFVSFDDDDPTGLGDSVSVCSSGVYSSVPTTAVGTPIEKKSFHEAETDNNNSDISNLPTASTSSTAVMMDESHSSESKEKEFNNNDAGSTNTVDALVVNKDSENESSEPSVSVEAPVISKPFYSIYDRPTSTTADSSLCSVSVKSADCISVNSVYSDCSERLDLECADLDGLEIPPTSQRLKPIVNDVSSGNSSRGGSSFSHPDFSHDLIPVPSYDSRKAQELRLDVEPQDISSSSSKIQSPATPMTPTKAEAQMRVIGSDSTRTPSSETASINYSLKNDEAVQKLKAILDREVETVAALRADLAEEKRNSGNHIKILEAKIESLGKDNEILRHQLKKYVGAVQMLKREGSRRLSLENDESIDNNYDPSELVDDASHEAAEYERKLIQVAEMHGELMEFNSHLQRTIQRKDAALKRLKEELIDLRGPLATPLMGGEDDEDDDSWDIVESFSSADNHSNRSRTGSASARSRKLAGGSQYNERILINIWIPSVFLTGATNDLHHVYQVFVRIKDTEWNIYRRYSQFYSLHRELSKNDPIIQNFYFPPKKHLGNKDAKFVDERRRKLQEYLRAVMNHTLQTNSILASHPDKNLLISILPFFGESFNTQPSTKPKRERSRTRNLFFRQSAQPNQTVASGGQQLQFSNYPQYTGL